MIRRLCSSSSARWRQRQRGDSRVEDARRRGLRARSAFKLEEMDDRARILRPGARVVDLGAAPGGWSAVAVRRCGPGSVWAIDRLAMEPIRGVEIVRADFLVDRKIVDAFVGAEVDVVLSDMAPNTSGLRDLDHARSAELVHAALGFAEDRLRSGGAALVKLFAGPEQRDIEERMRRAFAKVRRVKPAASRAESREVYLLGTGRQNVGQGPRKLKGTAQGLDR